MLQGVNTLSRLALPLTLLLWVTAVAAQNPAPIRVGILHSSTGTMAISETALRDTMLMLIEEQNARGGLLGRPLEPVHYDPRSNWQLYAQQARRLLTLDKVAAIFGCWTSASRKAVLPVVEDLDGLLFYPVQYEGQESSDNIIYTGATPNQQAIPAVDYLREVRGVERWILAGTDYIYPRTTNRILAAYLASHGVAREDILLHYTPFGFQDWSEPVSRFTRYAFQGKKTAIVSTVNGDANVGLYSELQVQGVSASDLPVMAFSVGEQELSAMDAAGLQGHLAAWNYFMSLDSAQNKHFIEQWRRYTNDPHAVTNDPMEAHLVAFRLWVRAVEVAGTVDVAAVRQAITGLQVKNLSGSMVRVHENNHIDKPAMVAEIVEDGKLQIIWNSHGLIAPQAWSEHISGRGTTGHE